MTLHRGVATMGLDWGTCPKWLFDRMVALGRPIIEVLVEEYGPEEFIRRMGDPVWFQTLGTVLAFDWNASGLTTILTAALKESLRDQEHRLGIFIAGGKGKTSRKAPEQILTWGERIGLPEQQANALVHNSKMSAKVDSAMLQDGYQLYHHSFFFTRSGAWAVVQQGMNAERQSARRYHWSSDRITDIIQEPHSGIASQVFDRHARTLNMTSRKSEQNRGISLDVVQAGFATAMKDIQILRRHSDELARVLAIQQGQQQFSFAEFASREFTTHPVVREDFSRSAYLEKILARVAGDAPKTYEQFIATPGVGPKTVRALALVAEVIYGAPASWNDPARYAFAHGGKDATPYPVDTKTYDATIGALGKAVRRAALPFSEKEKAISRLWHIESAS